jgi:uncharacterized protein YjbI with pentapeptide repeats
MMTMKKLTPEQIKEDLAEHGKWLRGEGRKRIDWSGCNLDGASLIGASLIGASLNRALGVIRASCSWTDHGERGRQLLAVRIDGKNVYFCGCFKGSIKKLREYIKNGEEKYRASRTIAADFASARMAEMKNT